ncbi:MAG: barstar family protein [Azovibrio sp.]
MTSLTQVLNNLERAGPYRLPASLKPDLLATAQDLGWTSATVYPGGCGNAEQWLAELGKTLKFPEYFGANLDALYDCLVDTQVLNSKGLLLILGNLDSLGEDVDPLIAVLQAASDEWREQGRSLWALLDAPGLDLDPFPKT